MRGKKGILPEISTKLIIATIVLAIIVGSIVLVLTGKLNQAIETFKSAFGI